MLHAWAGMAGKAQAFQLADQRMRLMAGGDEQDSQYRAVPGFSIADVSHSIAGRSLAGGTAWALSKPLVPMLSIQIPTKYPQGWAKSGPQVYSLILRFIRLTCGQSTTHSFEHDRKNYERYGHAEGLDHYGDPADLVQGRR